jgi:hypothetical protein
MSTNSEGYWGRGQYVQLRQDVEDHQEQATKLDQDNPRWLVLWGTFSLQFVAFPLFDVPCRVVLCSRTTPELIRQMRQAEEIYCGRRDA